MFENQAFQSRILKGNPSISSATATANGGKAMAVAFAVAEMEQKLKPMDKNRRTGTQIEPK